MSPPPHAAAWLKFNKGNRNPSKAKVRRFAAAMIAGKWRINGECVKFSVTGRLLDGQSRLMACIAAKVPVTLEVRGGLPDATQSTMDAGETRRGTHTLEMLGESNPAILSPALALTNRWENGTLSGNKFGAHTVLENLDVAPLLAKHPALKQSVGWIVSAGYKIKNLMPAGEAAFFHYVFGRAHAGRRDAFFSALADGIGLTKESPAYHLRERLLAERVATAKISKRDRLALIIKAWNAAYARQKITMLSFKSEGERIESFPNIAGVK